MFAVLFKDVLLGWKALVLPKLLQRHQTLNGLTYEENTRQPYNNTVTFLKSLALHIHGNQRLEQKTSRIIKAFINTKDRLSPSQFTGVHLDDLPVVEEVLTLNILLYDIVILNGNTVGELAGRSVKNKQKYCQTDDIQPSIVIWATLMQFWIFSLFWFWHFFQINIQFEAT